MGWSDVLSAELVLPTKANGVRHLLDDALTNKGGELNTLIESDSFDFIRNYLLNEDCLSFQIPIGLPKDLTGTSSTNPITSRPMDINAMPP